MRALLLFACIAATSVVAQPFLVASRSITFHDPGSNRDIATNIYYPGLTAGSNAAVADGSFPVLVVGHGFVMSTDAYANIWNHFVPKGYIVAFPTTEGGFAPNHGNFGQDISYVAAALQAANTDVSSPFFAHVLPATALMGHSMGGGAALLAAAGNATIQTVVVLAPAETDPSAIAAAADVLVPTLVFAGSNDCITPMADHAGPMYDALTMPCRAFVNVNGGGHCYFAESNFNCMFGELTCTPAPSITRAQQHDVVNDLAGPWLDHFLLGDEMAFGAFLDSVAITNRAQCTTTCALPTSIASAPDEAWSLYPVPAVDEVRVSGLPPNTAVYVLDLTGREVIARLGLAQGGSLDLRSLASGTYWLIARARDGMISRAFYVSR